MAIGWSRCCAPQALLRYTDKIKWYFRPAEIDEWEVLHESATTDMDTMFAPIGFGDDRNALYVYKNVDGRISVVSQDLTGQRGDETIFSHPEVDTAFTRTLGKFNRVVGIGYHTDRLYVHYVDEEIKALSERLEKLFPDMIVSIIDESWDKRFYLVLVRSDQDPGTYYRLDLQESRMDEIFARRPEFANFRLAEMQPINYPARDEVEIPGYLTLPAKRGEGALPVIVMPHGGPQSRDIWDFDWLVQYMAARGYAVLQSNFRGSGGYGEDWAGDGGFQKWRQAISDINDGAAWLIEEGIADPDRICIVGWSYGGYAALLGPLEAPDLYQCAVSIAPVTDPLTLIRENRRFLNSKAWREFVGTEEETLEHGSPLRRAAEFNVPVQLFH